MPDSLSAAQAVVDTPQVHPLNNINAIQHPEKLYAHPIHGVWEVLGWIFLVAMVFYFMWLFINSALCRNESFDPADGQLRPLKDRPFSYARVQLFWWTLIILSCYWYFFMSYGVLLPLNSSIALLLGGPLAVFVFGKTIDNTQIKNNNADDNLPSRHQDIEKSKGLLTDILSDNTGISIHRLQAVFFNTIYGIGFIQYFCNNVKDHKYPLIEFEPWQLALLGISAAGYLAIKANENPEATKVQRKTQAMAVRISNTDNK